MAKELPYFRFYPSEWLEGDITLENDKTQSLFVKIMCWYWKKDCHLDLEFINKRLINGKATLKQCLNKLIDNNILKIDENQCINIIFLNEQYDLLSEKRQKFVESGRKGGLSNAKAKDKHRSSYKDKDKDKDKDKNIDKELNKVKYKELFEKINLEFKLDENFKEQVLLWLKYKSEKGQSYKETGMRTLIKSLLEDSNNDIKKVKTMVNNSIKNNYSGIFEVKEDQKPKLKPGSYEIVPQASWYK